MTENKPTWIGIQGGSCAGKSTLSNIFIDHFGSDNVLIIPLDRFYRPFDRQKMEQEGHPLNVDHPDSIDWALLSKVTKQLDSNSSVEIPLYDYVSGFRKQGNIVESRSYIIVEGLWTFYEPDIRKLFSIKLYIETPADVRLVRRLRRDILQDRRGWTLEKILDYYSETARQMHHEYVEPGKDLADLVINGQKDMETQLGKITQLLNS